MMARLALVLSVAALASAGALGSAEALGARAQPQPTIPANAMGDPEQARVDYLEQCAGCHGVNGSTAPANLPELKGRVGWFMCTPESRAYLIRLPNVAHSRITDNAELADLVNYVVFVLGEGSAPAGTQPFNGEEVAHERQFALANASLIAERARHAAEAVHQCHAPVSLKLLYPGAPR